MDIEKLFNKVMRNKDVQDVPFLYVAAVVIAVVEAISSGECFYENE